MTNVFITVFISALVSVARSLVRSVHYRCSLISSPSLPLRLPLQLFLLVLISDRRGRSRASWVLMRKLMRSWTNKPLNFRQIYCNGAELTMKIKLLTPTETPLKKTISLLTMKRQISENHHGGASLHVFYTVYCSTLTSHEAHGRPLTPNAPVMFAPKPPPGSDSGKHSCLLAVR